jgi:hypothetical protein
MRAVVAGSDICYFEEDFPSLLETLDHLDATTSVIGIQNRQGCHEMFAAAAAALGWTVECATTERHLHGYPITNRYSCSRCTVYTLTRKPASLRPGLGGLLYLARDDEGNSEWRFA